LGVAIVPAYLITEQLKKGLLVCARETRLKGQDSYYMVIQKNKINDNKVQAFSQWLLKWRD
jgi:DNA-binding transcriptional LysR family regulator